MTSRETNQGQSEKKKAKTGHSPLATRCKGYGGACPEYAEEGREGGREKAREGRREAWSWLGPLRSEDTPPPKLEMECLTPGI